MSEFTDINIRLLETNDQIRRNIEMAISEEVNKLVKKNRNKTIKKLSKAVASWIKNSPEVISLQSEQNAGSLNAQFGLPNGLGFSAANAIAAAVVETVRIEVDGFSKELRGKISFYVQPDRLQNLLTLPEGVLQIANGALPWLDWLITQGNRTIITGYEYVPSSDGRSGGGTMVAGGVWRVPPEFSGTTDNNFITRALSGRQYEISRIMEGLLR